MKSLHRHSLLSQDVMFILVHLVRCQHLSLIQKLKSTHKGHYNLMMHYLHLTYPLSLPINASLADTYAHCGFFEQAKDQYLKTLELDNSFRSALNGLGWVYYFLGEYDEAIKILKHSQELLGDPLKSNAALGFMYARLDMQKELQNCLTKLSEREKNEKDISFLFDYAIINLGLKDYDKVFEYLNRAFNEKIGGLIFIKSRYWKEIHDDPRFRKLLNRMNLPFDGFRINRIISAIYNP